MSYTDGDNGWQNAVKHCLLACKLCVKGKKSLADMHENTDPYHFGHDATPGTLDDPKEGSPGHESGEMDIINNDAGCKCADPILIWYTGSTHPDKDTWVDIDCVQCCVDGTASLSVVLGPDRTGLYSTSTPTTVPEHAKAGNFVLGVCSFAAQVISGWL